MSNNRFILAFGFCILLANAQDWGGMPGGDMVSPDMNGGGYGGGMGEMNGGFDGMGGGEMVGNPDMPGYGGGYVPGNGQMGNFGGYPNGQINPPFPTQ